MDKSVFHVLLTPDTGELIAVFCYELGAVPLLSFEPFPRQRGKQKKYTI